MGKLFNRVSMTVASAPGTGVVTLGSASSGKQTFAAAGAVNGDTVSYVIEENTTSWEIGTGTYSSTGPTLTRTSIIASSNGGSAVSFGAAAVVMCDMLKEDYYAALLAANNLSDLANATTARTNLGLTALATTTPGTGVAAAIATPLNSAGGLAGYSTLGSAAFVATSAFEASGAVSSHAALLTGVHGLNITAGKALNLSNTLTFTGTDSSSVAFGTGGTVAYVAGSSGQIIYNNSGALGGALLRYSAANLSLGAADAAAPVAQTLDVQSVVAGTSNTAGVNFTIAGSKSTGSAIGGALVFGTAWAGGSGTAQNPITNMFELSGSGYAMVENGTTFLVGTGNLASANKQISLTAYNATVSVASGGSFGFTNSSTNGNSGQDIFITRPAAGVVKMAGASSLGCALQLAGFTFATLPTGAAGMIAYITDGSASYAVGATISAGGGANKVYAYHDGANWKALTASF